MNVMTVSGDAMRGALKDFLGYIGWRVAGNCGCGSAECCWWWGWVAMGKICSCRLRSLQGQVVRVADWCERALDLLWKERT